MEMKEMLLFIFSDLNGKLLLKEKIEGILERKTLGYDFSNRNQGIIIKIKQGKNTVTEKVIIQK